MNFDQAMVLGRFYAKNLLLMKLAGRLNGRFNRAFRQDTARRWERLREEIAGHERWLVVGNGPSLNVEDLEALGGIPAIASNKINLLFPKTSWRPRLITIADPLLLHKLSTEHYDTVPEILLPHTHIYMAKTPRKLAWRHIIDDEGERRYVSGDERIGPMNGIFVGRTITVANLQLAIWAGAKIIYLIGCDHSYGKEQAFKRSSGRVSHQNGSDHFDPNYRKPGEVVNVAPIDLMDRAYANMQIVAQKHGVEIINITRTTALSAFPVGTVEDALRAISASAIGRQIA